MIHNDQIMTTLLKYITLHLLTNDLKIMYDKK
jgi:hypothetical protein